MQTGGRSMLYKGRNKYVKTLKGQSLKDNEKGEMQNMTCLCIPHA